MLKTKDVISKWPEDPLRKPVKRLWLLLKNEAKRVITWLLFYQPENNYYAMLHALEIFILVSLIYLFSRG
jgi:hypothetical protein